MLIVISVIESCVDYFLSAADIESQLGSSCMKTSSRFGIVPIYLNNSSTNPIVRHAHHAL